MELTVAQAEANNVDELSRFLFDVALHARTFALFGLVALEDWDYLVVAGVWLADPLLLEI